MKNLGIIMSMFIVLSITKVSAQDLALCTSSDYWTEANINKAVVKMLEDDKKLITKKLVADETTMIEGAKTFRIICSNEILQKRLLLLNFKSCIITKKTDRLGKYLQYSFVFDNTLKDAILTNLK